MKDAKKWAGIYSILIGGAIIAIWAMFALTGQIPEMKTAPLSIGAHLAAEFVTAGALIIAGAALLKKYKWAVKAYLVATGMLLYTLIASPGFFGQKDMFEAVFMFAGMALIAVGLLAIVIKEEK